MVKELSHYSMENHPTVYDEEALTALQLAARTASKVNECIAEVNNIPKKVADDVKSHITGGTFDKQIDEHTETLTNSIENSARQLSETEKNLTARLNTLLGQVVPGGTSMDAEVIDSRTGADGTMYPSAGEAIRDQSRMAFSSSGVRVSTTNYASVMNNAGNAPMNRFVFIDGAITEDMVADLPEYGEYGCLLTMNYTTLNPHGAVQLYFNARNEAYFRFEYGSATAAVKWQMWCRFVTSQSAGCLNFCTGMSPRVRIEIDNVEKVLRIVDDANNGILFGGEHFAAVNTLVNTSVSLETETNGTYLFYIRNKQLLKEVFTAYRAKSGDIIVAELYMNTLNGGIVHTVAFIAKPFGSDIFRGHASDIFRTVCCVGDSYTSGYIGTANGVSNTNEEYAWPHYLANLTGNTFHNCGVSGANVITWQEHERGLAKVRSVGPVQAYIVGLGLNDKSDSDRAIPLGTIADVGTNNRSYYGGLSKIVSELHKISPDAFIFVQTMPAWDEVSMQYNNAIREMVAAFGEAYNVHLLDLYNYVHWYALGDVATHASQGHYTAIGYQKFAELLRHVWSEYVTNHPNAFANVHNIPVE